MFFKHPVTIYMFYIARYYVNKYHLRKLGVKKDISTMNWGARDRIDPSFLAGGLW